MLDPRRMLTFREVARLGSFSRAAEELSLTQPAVSQQILSLERQLGIRLIDRGPGGLALTDAGGLLLRHADAVSGRLRLASKQLGALVSEERRHLAVGAFPSAIATFVPEALVRMRAAEPDLEVSVSEGTLEELIEAVGDGTLNIAVLFQMPPPHDASTTTSSAGICSRSRWRRHCRRGTASRADGGSTSSNSPTTSGRRRRAMASSTAPAGGRIRAEHRLRDARRPRVPRARGVRARRDAHRAPARRASRGIATPAVTADPARRTIYAIRPGTDSHPLTDRLLEELAESSGSM